jgi:hypothetical protein
MIGGPKSDDTIVETQNLDVRKLLEKKES